MCHHYPLSRRATKLIADHCSAVTQRAPGRRPVKAITLLVSIFLLTACGPQQDDATRKKRVRGPARVELVTLLPQQLQPTLTRPATLEPRREVRVFNQEEGRLTELPPYEGDRVAAGEVIARLDDRLLRAEFNKADATRKQARLDLRRLERLVQQKMVADEAIERARTALAVAGAEVSLLRARLDYSVIQAPFDAVVAARLVEPGDVLARFSHLLTLSDASTLTAEVGVSELWLPRLHVGAMASVTIDALPGKTYPGRIERIHPGVNRDTRQGLVEVVLNPVPDGARPGQLCRVTFTATGHEALLVPFVALQFDRAGEYVMVAELDLESDAEGAMRARRVNLRTGSGFGERLEVLDGLEPGARVVVRGLLGLKDGDAVSAAPDDSGVDAGETSP